MFTPIERENPILLGAVDAPPGYTNPPKVQAQAWARQHLVPENGALHMPDGSYIKAP